MLHLPPINSAENGEWFLIDLSRLGLSGCEPSDHLDKTIIERFVASELEFLPFIIQEAEAGTPRGAILAVVPELAYLGYERAKKRPLVYSEETHNDAHGAPCRKVFKHVSDARCPCCPLGVQFGKDTVDHSLDDRGRMLGPYSGDTELVLGSLIVHRIYLSDAGRTLPDEAVVIASFRQVGCD